MDLDQAGAHTGCQALRFRYLTDLEAEVTLLTSAMAGFSRNPRAAHAAVMEEDQSHSGQVLRRQPSLLDPAPPELKRVCGEAASVCQGRREGLRSVQGWRCS
jgi:hypothetical protein